MNRARVRKALAGINVLGCPVKRGDARCRGVALVPVTLLERARSQAHGNLKKKGKCLTCGAQIEFHFQR